MFLPFLHLLLLLFFSYIVLCVHGDIVVGVLHTNFGRMLAGSSHFFRLSKKFQFCSLITISVNAIMYAYRHIAFNDSNNVTNMYIYAIAICFIHIEALLTNKRSMRFGIPKKGIKKMREKLEEKSNNMK